MKKMFYMIENHPADSRVQIDDSGTCQTLSARMGTGVGNVPMVMFIASSHPGSYTGQDAYNDMLITIERNNDEMDVCRKRSTASDVHAERNEYTGLYARSANSRRGY